ncbi:nucleotidyltransferase family protein [uncultured Meiothermus sp.]|jgi:CTP:molybdopterin cytidylyltransferase MocA|uniref:nucleotidyltransferase family protein n=1 Tax=uncultured Meiothermus sp. TaxID=157471 RepID=UPI002620962E|nr:nucleotidyltransferase family protein [uncultured Meiothermus sp.]
MHSIDAIILSAGRASRFGVPKFLLPAGEGHVLLTRVLERALGIADGRIVVILGRKARVAGYALERWLQTQPGSSGSRVYPVLNPHYPQGQSTSLKAGIRVLYDARGALVFLADMPAVQANQLEQLRHAILNRGPEIVAVTAGEQGQIRPPVFLSNQLFPEVERLSGDQGARAVLLANQGIVEQVEWGLGPWFCDVDDWQTYRDLARKSGWASEPFVPLLRETHPTSEIEALVDAALAAEIVPWLSPGLLLLASEGETRWLGLHPSHRGVHGVILGPAQTPAAYLQLVRRASLAALAVENHPSG